MGWCLVPSIAVVGSLNIDLIAYTKRVPNAGETVIGERFQMGFGGKGANQAVMAARLGGRVSMVGALGDDVYAGMTFENLDRPGRRCDARRPRRGLERRRADLGRARWDEPDHRRGRGERPGRPGGGCGRGSIARRRPGRHRPARDPAARDHGGIPGCPRAWARPLLNPAPAATLDLGAPRGVGLADPERAPSSRSWPASSRSISTTMRARRFAGAKSLGAADRHARRRAARQSRSTASVAASPGGAGDGDRHDRRRRRLRRRVRLRARCGARRAGGGPARDRVRIGQRHAPRDAELLRVIRGGRRAARAARAPRAPILEQLPAAVLARDEERVVRVAPGPDLARLRRPDQGVPGRVRMAGGVAVGLLSQQAGLPHTRHWRRCTQVSPSSTHAWQTVAARRQVGHRGREVGTGKAHDTKSTRAGGRRRPPDQPRWMSNVACCWSMGRENVMRMAREIPPASQMPACRFGSTRIV